MLNGDLLGTKFWDRLDRIQATLDLSEDLLAEHLEVTQSELIRLRQLKIIPSVSKLDRLAAELGISLDGLMFGPVDYVRLAIRSSRAKRKSGPIPEIYLEGAFSRRRTSIDVLRYLETYYGWKAVQRLLKRFDVSAEIFDDPDALISLNFLRDVCEYLVQRGFTEENLVEMGRFTLMVNQGSVVSSALQGCRTPKEPLRRPD